MAAQVAQFISVVVFSCEYVADFVVVRLMVLVVGVAIIGYDICLGGLSAIFICPYPLGCT